MSERSEPRPTRRMWRPDEDALLRRVYADLPTHQIAAQLQRQVSGVYQRARALGLKKSEAYLASPWAGRQRPGAADRGKETRFKPGLVPANKGLRRPGWGPGRMKQTQFRPGVRQGLAAAHHMPVGSTRLIGGYVYRKVSDTPNVPYSVNWKKEHVLVWERAHGPMPAGHAIAFRNRDTTDVRLDNLEIVSRAELMRRNSVNNLPKPLAKTIQLLGALKRQIRRRTRAESQH